MIDENSTVDQIIDDECEDRFSCEATTKIANVFLLSKHLPFVTISIVRRLIKRLSPKVYAVGKRVKHSLV